MLVVKSFALAVYCCFVHHATGAGLLNLGENEIKLAQSAVKSAIVAPEVVEAESTPNLRTEAKSYNLIRTSFFSDSACTMAGDVPFLYIAPGQCVPNTDGGNSYKMTISGSTVTEQLFTDLACQMPASSSTTATYTTSQGSSACVATLIPATTYITVSLIYAAPGKIPTGSDYGTYTYLVTSEAACNAFSTSNVLNNFVAAQPFSLIGSSGDAPFGITYNVAQALTCSADGKSVIVDAWQTKVKNGNLTVVGGLPAGTGRAPLGGCYPVGQMTTLYYRLVCI